MAIIFSYPAIKSTNVNSSDKLIISQMNTDGNPTKTISISELSKAIASGAATGGPYLPLTAGPTVPLTGDLYMAPNGAGPSAGSKNIVFRGIDDLGNELDGGRIFTVDSTINPSGQDLYFQNADDNGVLATNLMIDAFGSVGIGTTSPNFLLDVNGAGNFATNLNVGVNVQFGGTTDFRFFQSSGSIGLGTSSPNFKMDIGGGDLRMEENYGILFGGTGSNHQNFMIYTTGDPFGGNYPGTWSVGVGNRPGALANPALTVNRVNPGTDGQITFNKYGSGTFTGTAAFDLSIDASGNIIETATGSGVTGTGTTDYLVKFTDGPNGVIGDVPGVLEQAGEVIFQQDVRFDDVVQFDGGTVSSFQNIEMLDGAAIKFQDSAGPVDVEINSVVGSNTLSISNNVSLPSDKKLNFGPSAYIEGTVAGSKIIVRASDDILFQPGNVQHVEFVSTGGVNLNSLGSYADDAAAGVGGVPQNGLYQTDGTGAAPLNVAGIVMIKQ
tara:strand:- start:82 stop:1569 length:1488 start_codon:yes stop_codon:yes gene_type:complete